MLRRKKSPNGRFGSKAVSALLWGVAYSQQACLHWHTPQKMFKTTYFFSSAAASCELWGVEGCLVSACLACLSSVTSTSEKTVIRPNILRLKKNITHNRLRTLH